jgi:hypothetical protein
MYYDIRVELNWKGQATAELEFFFFPSNFNAGFYQMIIYAGYWCTIKINCYFISKEVQIP